MSTTAVLIVVGSFVVGYLVVTFLMKVVKDAKEIGKDDDRHEAGDRNGADDEKGPGSD